MAGIIFCLRVENLKDNFEPRDVYFEWRLTYILLLFNFSIVYSDLKVIKFVFYWMHWKKIKLVDLFTENDKNWGSEISAKFSRPYGSYKRRARSGRYFHMLFEWQTPPGYLFNRKVQPTLSGPVMDGEFIPLHRPPNWHNVRDKIIYLCIIDLLIKSK